MAAICNVLVCGDVSRVLAEAEAEAKARAKADGDAGPSPSKTFAKRPKRKLRYRRANW